MLFQVGLENSFSAELLCNEIGVKGVNVKGQLLYMRVVQKVLSLM